MADKFIPTQPLGCLVWFRTRVGKKIKIRGPFRDFWKDAVQIAFVDSCMLDEVTISYSSVTKIRVAITEQSPHPPKAHSKPIRIGKVTRMFQDRNETARI